MSKRRTIHMFEQARLEYLGKAERGALTASVLKQLRAWERKKVRKLYGDDSFVENGGKEADLGASTRSD